MTSEANFLSAIRDDPDDDAVRLIFADWLEDQGDTDRAELIRAQVEGATFGPDEPRPAALREREEELLALHRPTWAGGLEKLVDEVEFQRGLPEKVVVTGRDFEKHGEQLFGNTAVREVRLGRISRRAATLAKNPLLARF